MAARAFLSLSSRLGGLAPVGNIGRRTYSAAAEAVARKEPVDAAASDKAPRKEECFWMRDPKTGCWMPENHLYDVDAADLRARLLFSKKD